MARILGFKIEGLAGRKETYSRRLNEDVNIFFGINGSGKTTLLKILHSALSADSSILKGLPFVDAEVEVFLNRYERTFKRRVEQAKKQSTSEGDPAPAAQLPQQSLFGTSTATIEKRPTWTSEPAEPDGSMLTHYRSGFLPITRLYRNVGKRTTGTRTISEEELDNRFAEEVQRLWTDYNAGISGEIAEAQQIGLANILHSVLSGDEVESQAGPAPPTDEAYARVSAFLKRQNQELFSYIIDTPESFARKYETESQIKTIVRQIDNIESRIEEVTAPKSRLEKLLQSMYSGNKRLVLTEKEIRVEVSEGTQIGLPALSSGEKQLFFISLAVLRSSNHSLIIDEPELSMHVDWQTKLIASLRELNPDAQLIVATHSPGIMANIPDNQVFSL